MDEDIPQIATSSITAPSIAESTNSDAPSAIIPEYRSPYLNYNPRYLRQALPEFVFIEIDDKQKGRFELAFSHIGTSLLVGATVGSIAGIHNGLRLTKSVPLMGNVWKTQMLNHIAKQGSATAKIFGTLVVIYSTIDVILQNLRNEDSSLNRLIAGTGTGVLYKSSAGLRNCTISGGFGLGISALYCLYDFVRSKYVADTKLEV